MQYDPSGHILHISAPLAELYLPNGQFEQASLSLVWPVLFPYVPAGHSVLLVDVQYDPSGHMLHIGAPLAELYLLTAQSLQEGSVPYLPGEHKGVIMKVVLTGFLPFILLGPVHEGRKTVPSSASITFRVAPFQLSP